MSFSADVKKELAGQIPEARHCRIAELAAFYKMQGRNSRRAAGNVGDGFHFRTESRKTADLLFTLFQRTFNIRVVVSLETHARKGGHIYHIESTDDDSLSSFRQAIGHSTLLRMDCCKKAFLRGAFLSGGSVSDPEKSYHLEIVCPEEGFAMQIRDLMRALGLDGKVVIRKKDYVVYLKEGDQIVEFLGMLGANLSFLNIENVRILKEMRGNVNRRVNCEAANITKTVVSAVRQIEDIEYIRDCGGFGDLSPALREMAEIRLAYPEASLTELGDLLDPRLGKSGVNHRLRKLSRIAAGLRQQ